MLLERTPSRGCLTFAGCFNYLRFVRVCLTQPYLLHTALKKRKHTETNSLRKVGDVDLETCSSCPKSLNKWTLSSSGDRGSAASDQPLGDRGSAAPLHPPLLPEQVQESVQMLQKYAGKETLPGPHQVTCIPSLHRFPRNGPSLSSGKKDTLEMVERVLCMGMACVYVVDLLITCGRSSEETSMKRASHGTRCLVQYPKMIIEPLRTGVLPYWLCEPVWPSG